MLLSDIEKEYIKLLMSIAGVFTVCRVNDDKDDLNIVLTLSEKLCNQLLSFSNSNFRSLRFELENEIRASNIHNKSMVLGLTNPHELELKNRKIHSVESIKFYLKILLKIIPLLKQYLQDNKLEQFKDLVEAVHCLTDALTNHVWDEKAFWETHLIPYRLKWDKNFLIEEETSVFQ